jgi:hypothetical protein
MAKYLIALAEVTKRGDTEQVLFDGLSRSPQVVGRDSKFIPGPDKWLHGGGYDDEMEAVPASPAPPALMLPGGKIDGNRKRDFFGGES